MRHNPGPLADLGCACDDACWCDEDEACEHGAYTFEDDENGGLLGRQVCADCFGTLNDEVFDDDE